MNPAYLLRGEVHHARYVQAGHRFRHRSQAVLLKLSALGERAGGYGWGLNRHALLSVRDRHHGDGGPLLQWLDQKLAGSGLSRQAGDEVWLWTFPAVLGYVFKPVSFWIVQPGQGGPVRAIVAEVNNTFGDRHTYVLNPGPDGYRNGETLRADKAFYVSPFFPVSGHYEFRFFWPDQPEAPGARAVARIELWNQDSRQLSTSVSGQLTPMTQRRAALAFCQSPWQSMAIISRIHLHALRLWRKGVTFIPRSSA